MGEPAGADDDRVRKTADVDEKLWYEAMHWGRTQKPRRSMGDLVNEGLRRVLRGCPEDDEDSP